MKPSNLAVLLCSVLFTIPASCSSDRSIKRNKYEENEEEDHTRKLQKINDFVYDTDVTTMDNNFNFIEDQYMPNNFNIIDEEEEIFTQSWLIRSIVQNTLLDSEEVSQSNIQKRLEMLKNMQLETLSEYHLLYNGKNLLKTLLLQNEVFPDLSEVLDEEGLVKWNTFKSKLVHFVENVDSNNEHQALLALFAGLDLNYFSEGEKKMFTGFEVFIGHNGNPYHVEQEIHQSVDPIGIYTYYMTADLKKYEKNLISYENGRLSVMNILQNQPRYGYLLAYEPTYRNALCYTEETLDGCANKLSSNLEVDPNAINAYAFRVNLLNFIIKKKLLGRISSYDEFAILKHVAGIPYDKIVKVANTIVLNDCYLALIYHELWNFENFENFEETVKIFMDGSDFNLIGAPLQQHVRTDRNIFMTMDFNPSKILKRNIQILIGAAQWNCDNSRNLLDYQEICNSPNSTEFLRFMRENFNSTFGISFVDEQYEEYKDDPNKQPQWEKEMSELSLGEERLLYIINNWNVVADDDLFSIIVNPKLFKSLLTRITEYDPLWFSKKLRDILLEKIKMNCTPEFYTVAKRASWKVLNNAMVNFYEGNLGDPIRILEEEDWKEFERLSINIDISDGFDFESVTDALFKEIFDKDLREGIFAKAREKASNLSDLLGNIPSVIEKYNTQGAEALELDDSDDDY